MKNMTKKKVIVRFPPSPTGNLHIGGARTALFNYLFAKHKGGSFLLRIEDTDKERSKKEFEENILGALAWLGITHDNKKLVRQSERTDIYRKHLKQLVDEGKAYLSKEEVKEGSRSEVIRFKNPNKTISFKDLIRGEIVFNTTDLGDFVIAKSLEEPLYHLAVVIDDYEMNITHVIRGEDHISNTPRQILIQEALDFPRPIYAHIPLILARDKSKLSKRHGAVSVTEYRDKGYSPSALVNYLALLGWNPGGEREIWSVKELALQFDITKVQKGGAIFDEVKLRAINREYLQALPETEKKTCIQKILKEKTGAGKIAPEKLSAIVKIAFERASTSGDIEEAFASGEFDLFFSPPEIQNPTSILWKGDTNPRKTVERLKKCVEIISVIPEKDFRAKNIKLALMNYAESEGKGSVLW